VIGAACGRTQLAVRLTETVSAHDEGPDV